MNDEEVKMMKRMFKAQDKFIKVINQIIELPDTQRKKLKAMNIINPKFDKEMPVLIKEYKEIKKQFKKIEEPKSADTGLSVSEMVERMTL